jgi:Domain of unknown function (DUF202)
LNLGRTLWHPILGSADGASARSRGLCDVMRDPVIPASAPLTIVIFSIGYLAAERTFLAWIRTGLALMGFGFVVARFGLFLQTLQISQPNLPLRTNGLFTLVRHGAHFARDRRQYLVHLEPHSPDSEFERGRT